MTRSSDDDDNDKEDAPILVTGADGYLAGVLVRQLLQAGCHVHATVLDLEASRPQQELLRQQIVQIQHGCAAAAAVDHTSTPSKRTTTGHTTPPPRSRRTAPSIRFFQANLLHPGDFDQAMKGCRVVIHTASPFLLGHTNDGRRLDAQRDLVDVAVLGTRHVLETAVRTRHVRRVVHTSSVGAIYGDAIDAQSVPHQILNETVWNTTSTVQHQPYFYSKTLSERTAWEIAQRPNCPFELVVINPSMILGPGLQYYPHSESFQTLHKLGGFHYSMLLGCPNLVMPVVDVRDVATAHVRAALLDHVPSGRYIVSAPGRAASLPKLCRWLRRAYPDYSIPATIAWVPRCILAWLAPILQPGLDARTIAGNVHVPPFRLDTSAAQQWLQMTKYRDPATTVQEMFQQMIDAGAVRPGPRPDWVGNCSVLVVIVAMVVGCIWTGSGYGGSLWKE